MDEQEDNKLKGIWKVILKPHITIEFDGKQVSNLRFASDEANLIIQNNTYMILSKIFEGNVIFIPGDNILMAEFIPVKQKVTIH